MKTSTIERRRSTTIALDETPIPKKRSLVRVTKYRLSEWDENAWVEITAERLANIATNGSSDCYYLNPVFTVSAPRFDLEFSRKARRCQTAWYQRVDQVLGRKHRKRRERQLDFISRQAAYTGVLFVEGQFIRPHEWTKMERALEAASVETTSASVEVR